MDFTIDWNELLNSAAEFGPGVAVIALRLACAMLVGVVIGLEREYTHRPAGLRTHVLVALGACVVSITGQLLFAQYSGLGAAPDPARLSAQVVTGVGFLGAGTIMKEGPTVKGLTTAASLWAVACLGLAAGFGYYALAITGLVFIFITLTLLEVLQHRFIQVESDHGSYTVETDDLSEALNRINDLTHKPGTVLEQMKSERLENGWRLQLSVEFSGRRHRAHAQAFFDALATAPEIRSVHSDTHALI